MNPKKHIFMLSWRDMKHPMKGGDGGKNEILNNNSC